mgnify:CR=1 FL=1
MFQGLRTVIYHVPPSDLPKAVEWFTGVAGHPPYFSEPFYVGFEVGGYELGVWPDEKRPGSVTTYWGTPDINAEYARLIALGAKPNEEITDVGDGIRVASFFTPFGNVVGIIENPHFKADHGG